MSEIHFVTIVRRLHTREIKCLTRRSRAISKETGPRSIVFTGRRVVRTAIPPSTESGVMHVYSQLFKSLRKLYSLRENMMSLRPARNYPRKPTQILLEIP